MRSHDNVINFAKPSARTLSPADTAAEYVGAMVTKMEELSNAAFVSGHQRGFLSGWINGAVVGASLFTLGFAVVFALIKAHG